MPKKITAKSNSLVVSAMSVCKPLAASKATTEKRGTPGAALRSLRDHLSPEPEVLKAIGAESQRNGTDKLTARQIDQVIKSTRAERSKRG